MHILIMIIYIAFIALGLPCSLLGATWPSMFRKFESSLAFAGVLSFLMAFFNAIANRYANTFVRKYGPGHVATFSMALLAVSIVGFALAPNIIVYIIFTAPYGIASGGISATINNYVATHYESKYVSWLHAMWGLGAASGPYIIRYTFKLGASWRLGYVTIAVTIFFVLFLMVSTLSWWKDAPSKIKLHNKEIKSDYGFFEVMKIKGVKEIIIMFFSYCAIEQTIALWASSYFVFSRGVDAKVAASYGGLFFIGITIGRALSGFIAMKLNDNKLIRLGEILIIIGISLLFVSNKTISLIGLIIIGLGCAPIFPSLLHLTPEIFKGKYSESIITAELTTAQLSTSFMPPAFGFFLRSESSSKYLPYFLLVLTLIMLILHIKLNHDTATKKIMVKNFLKKKGE